MNIKNLMLYAGYNKKIFNEINKKAVDFDKKVWRIISIISVVMFALMTAISLNVSSLDQNMPLYAAVGTVCLVLSLGFWMFVKKDTKHINLVLTYLTGGVIMAWSIVRGVVFSKDDLAVAFMILLVVIPVLITDRPIKVIGLIVLSDIAFVIMVLIFEEGHTLRVDIVNAVVFFIISIVINSYTLIFKYANYKLNYDLHNRARIDTLTGLGNETAYYETVDEIKELIKEGNFRFAVMVMDVNCVKITNDTYGHKYGCNLIVTAGKTLPNVFTRARLFHIGGDEFIAIFIGDDVDKIEHYNESFKKKLEYREIEYKGVKCTLSLAQGYKVSEGEMKYSDVFQAADDAMYENKKFIKEKYGLKGR